MTTPNAIGGRQGIDMPTFRPLSGCIVETNFVQCKASADVGNLHRYCQTHSVLPLSNLLPHHGGLLHLSCSPLVLASLPNGAAPPCSTGCCIYVSSLLHKLIIYSCISFGCRFMRRVLEVFLLYMIHKFASSIHSFCCLFFPWLSCIGK